MADVSIYTTLITSEHADKPKFMAMVTAIGQTFVDAQNLVASLPRAFDLDTAVGAQLDAVGLWVGISRRVDVPIDNVYFTINQAGLGFDQGVWFYKFDPTTGVVLLDDGSYRLLLRTKIAANNWQSNPAAFVAILRTILAPATVVVTDGGNMTVAVAVSGNPPSNLFKQLILAGRIPIKPAGVQVTYTFS